MKPSPELITNGGFDTDTVWTKGTGWVISGGVASSPDALGNLSQTAVLVPGRRYRVTFTVLNYVDGSTRFRLGTPATNATLRTANGTYVEDGTADGTTFQIVTTSTGTYDIDNVSVKEVKTIANPSPELVTNGGFDTGDDWTPGNNWSISAGVLSGTGAQSNTAQSIGHTIGFTYQITYTILNYSAGSVAVYVGQGAATARSANGTYTELVTPVNNSNLVIDGQGGGFTGDIDNVSVKLVKTLIK